MEHSKCFMLDMVLILVNEFVRCIVGGSTRIAHIYLAGDKLKANAFDMHNFL